MEHVGARRRRVARLAHEAPPADGGLRSSTRSQAGSTRVAPARSARPVPLAPVRRPGSSLHSHPSPPSSTGCQDRKPAIPSPRPPECQGLLEPASSGVPQSLLAGRLEESREGECQTRGPVAQAGIDDSGFRHGSLGGAQRELERRALPVRPLRGVAGGEESRGDTGVAVAPGGPRVPGGAEARGHEAGEGDRSGLGGRLRQQPGDGALEEAPRALGGDPAREGLGEDADDTGDAVGEPEVEARLAVGRAVRPVRVPLGLGPGEALRRWDGARFEPLHDALEPESRRAARVSLQVVHADPGESVEELRGERSRTRVEDHFERLVDLPVGVARGGLESQEAPEVRGRPGDAGEARAQARSDRGFGEGADGSLEPLERDLLVSRPGRPGRGRRRATLRPRRRRRARRSGWRRRGRARPGRPRSRAPPRARPRRPSPRGWAARFPGPSGSSPCAHCP